MGLVGRFDRVLKQGLEPLAVLSGGRMDDDRSPRAGGLHFSHPKSMPPQPPPGLRSIQVDVKPVALDGSHRFATPRLVSFAALPTIPPAAGRLVMPLAPRRS